MTNPTAAILIIGNEILSGRTQEVNVTFLARR
jgi:molybdopterin-biosynthesis enzyme MoeA-like protein